MAESDSSGDARRWVYAVASLLFFLSGATGLAYEVIWFKRFSHVWGNSTIATATVVASFLLGLGLGAAAFGRLADRVRSPLRWYGLFEAGIGLMALAVPTAASAMVEWVVPVVAPLHDFPLLHSLARFGLTFAVIGPPCILMGGTLPLLVRQFGAAAWIYAVNTLGAAVGCYLTGFHLLASFGLSRTNTGTAALNLAIALVAFAASRRTSPALASEPHPSPEAVGATGSVAGRASILAVAALTGAAALLLQLVWSRQLAVTVGGSTYAFTAMLVVILVGIGLGSLVVHPWLRQTIELRLSTALVTIAIMAATLAGQAGRDLLIDLAGVVHDLRATQTFNAFICVVASAVLELAPALGMGILFPMLVHLARARREESGAAVGAVYAWNTFGTIAGALATPLVLMPSLGTPGCITIALGLYAVAVVLLALPATGGGLSRVALPLLAIAAVGLSIRSWNDDPRRAHMGFYMYGLKSPEEIDEARVTYFKEGAAASVLVAERKNGHSSMYVNGKVDASTDPTDMTMQVGTAYVPHFMRPKARDVLVIGLGSATTAGASLLFPGVEVTAVEIEPAIVEAARAFAWVNHRPEESPNFRVVIDDGRSYLQGTDETYDLILSEPSNPWIAGVSNLFTREFYEVVNRRLRPDGMLAQWIQLYALEPKDYALIVRTVASVFPHVALVLIAQGDTILLASQAPLDGDAESIRSAQQIVDASPAIQTDMRAFFGTTDVMTFLLNRIVLDRAGLERMAAEAGSTEINTDINLRLEFDAPQRLFGADRTQAIMAAMYSAADPAWFVRTYDRWGGDAAGAGIFHGLAMAFWKAGAPANANALAQYGYEKNPNDPALAADVFATADTVSPEAAERMVSTLIAHSTARASQIGQALLQTKPERAMLIFERLTALDGQSAANWQYLAVAYRAVGRFADAARATSAAQGLAPSPNAG